MVVADLAGGYDAGVSMVEKLELATPAVSFGGTETLVTHAASMSAATLSSQERAAMGISDGLVRVSVGLEHADDIIADLVQAIA